MSNIRLLKYVSGLALALVFTQPSASILYSASSPLDLIGWDDSKITEITLDSWSLNKTGEELLLSQIDNPTPTQVKEQYTYKKGYTETTSSSLSASLSSMFGTKLNSVTGTINTTVGISQSWTAEQTITRDWGPVCCAKESLFGSPIYSEFSGTVTWWYDDPLPGFTIETLGWSATLYQGESTRVQLDTAYTTTPCPIPSAFWLLASSLAALGLLKRKPHLISQA